MDSLTLHSVISVVIAGLGAVFFYSKTESLVNTLLVYYILIMGCALHADYLGYFN